MIWFSRFFVCVNSCFFNGMSFLILASTRDCSPGAGAFAKVEADRHVKIMTIPIFPEQDLNKFLNFDLFVVFVKSKMTLCKIW